MTFLPIAQRELRVAARQKATHRWRLFFAIGAAVLAAGIGLVALQMRAFMGGQAGVWIFQVLKWMAFAGACVSGIFLTSDSVSEEKREGTLGLLFLTDLRGHDVAAGKLLATSLRPFYSLLAIFPVMALSFVLGGVPSEEFRHSAAVICNTLFFSLALGLAVSVVSRDATRAMTATGLIMAGFLFLPLTARKATTGGWISSLEELSPIFAIIESASFRAAPFWKSVAITHGLAWGLLAATSWLSPRTWQQKRLRAPLSAQSKWLRWLTFNRAGKLRGTDPVAWIIARDRWAAAFATVAVAVSGILLVYSLVAPPPKGTSMTMPTPATQSNLTITTNGGPTSKTFSTTATVTVASPAFYAAQAFISLLSWLLELWLVVQVSRFYIEGRKSGFLELLLVTPIEPKEIVRSHWRALRQIFLAPVAAQMALTLVIGGLGFAANPTMGINLSTASEATILMMSVLAWAAGLAALGWFALWMGLGPHTVPVATLKTFAFVKILPGVAMTFAIGISMFMLVTSFGVAAPWMLITLPQALALLVNIGLAAFARAKIPGAFTNLREARAK